MGVVHYIGDKLANLVSKMGTDRDKASHNYYTTPVVDDLQLINAYRGSWLPRKIVDIPALDATRNWREWQADKDQISKIEALEKSLGLQRKVKEALTKARLFGGAAIYIGTGDSDPSKPLRETSQIRHLTVLTRRRITPGDMDIDPESENYGEPAWYEINGSRQVRVHPSRIVKFIGKELPDDDGVLTSSGDNGYSANLWGWGDPVLTSVMETCKHADGTTANIASLIFEAQVDVIKIPDFMAGLSDPEYEKQVLERLELAARAKGINGALLLDAEEDYEQKNANFSNLRDILMAFMQVVSGAADIPMTRLLGQTATGLNSTGESDTRNYYDSIRSQQELEIGPALQRLDDLIIRNALGDRPDDIWYRWTSLWQSTDSEMAEIGSKTASMIKALAETGLIPEDALSQAAVNVLTERGVMPGLEQAYDETETADPNSEEELSGA